MRPGGFFWPDRSWLVTVAVLAVAAIVVALRCRFERVVGHGASAVLTVALVTGSLPSGPASAGIRGPPSWSAPW